MKRYVALARVSSREQEREGFSLAVQEDALRNFATREGGEIVKLFRIAETASKTDERKAFRELIAYAKKNADKLDGLLFDVRVCGLLHFLNLMERHSIPTSNVSDLELPSLEHLRILLRYTNGLKLHSFFKYGHAINVFQAAMAFFPTAY